MKQHAMPKSLRLTLLHRTVRRRMDEYVRETGLTGTQFSVLGALGRLEAEDKGEVTQRALEDAAHVTHPTMTELLKKLEKKGFITCRPSEEDRRCKAVSSTPQSERLRRSLGEFDERVFAELCGELSEDEVAEFLRITDVMLENARKMNAAQGLVPCGGVCRRAEGCAAQEQKGREKA